MLIRYPPEGKSIKDSYQNAKSRRKKYAYTKAMALLRITKGNNSNSISP